MSSTEKVLLVLIVLASTLYPWLFDYWPTTDGPNNLANAYILASDGDQNVPFPTYLEVASGLKRFRPSNLHYELLIALGYFMPLLSAQKVIASLIFLLIPLSVLTLLSQVARPRMKSIFLILPLLCSIAMSLGFTGYLLSMVTGIFFLAVGWSALSLGTVQNDESKPRIGKKVMAMVVLFLSVWFHPFIGAISGLCLLVMLGQRLQKFVTWRDLVLIGGPAALFLIVTYCTGDAVSDDAIGWNHWLTLPEMIHWVYEAHMSYTRTEIYPKSVVMVVLFVLGLRFWWEHPLTGSKTESACLRLVVFLYLLYLILPNMLDGWWLCSTRPLLFGTYCLPLIVKLPHRLDRSRFFPIFCLVLWSLSFYLPYSTIKQNSVIFQNLIEVSSKIPIGSRVLSYEFDRKKDFPPPSPLDHIDSLLVFLRNAVNPHLAASNKPDMGGERFRIISYRKEVLARDGVLPFFREKFPNRWTCVDENMDPCLDKPSDYIASSVQTENFPYERIVLVNPPPDVREALSTLLVELANKDGVWIYIPRRTPGTPP